jgi:hypothetical protein
MNFNRAANYFIREIIKFFHGFKLTCKNIFSNLRVLRAFRGVK